MKFEEAVKSGFVCKASDVDEFRGYFDYIHNSPEAHTYYDLSDFYSEKKYELRRIRNRKEKDKAREKLNTLKIQLIEAKSTFEKGKENWIDVKPKINYYISCKEILSPSKMGQFVRLVYSYMFGKQFTKEDATVDMKYSEQVEWARCVVTHLSNILEHFNSFTKSICFSVNSPLQLINCIPDFEILNPILKKMCEVIYQNNWHSPKDTIVLDGVDLDCVNVDPALFPLFMALIETIGDVEDVVAEFTAELVKTPTEIMFVSPVTRLFNGAKHYACNILAVKANSIDDLANLYEKGSVVWYNTDGTPVDSNTSPINETTEVINSMDFHYLLGTKGWDIITDRPIYNKFYDCSDEDLIDVYDCGLGSIDLENPIRFVDEHNEEVSILDGIKRIWTEEVYLHTISDVTLLNFTNKLKELIPDWDKLGKATMKNDGTIEITWKGNKVDLEEK